MKGPKGKNILLVSDDQPLNNSFKSILEIEGYIVESTSICEQALKKAEKTRFELALLDTKHSDTQGNKLVKELKQLDRDIKTILICDYSSHQKCIDSLDHSIYDILLEPTPDELLHVAREATSSKERIEYWMGKNPRTRKAVTEYRILKKKGYSTSIHEISRKYGLNPAIATIQKHVSRLKKRKLW